MKVLISRSELVTLIGKIQSIVSVKPAIPILANILIEAYDNKLTISATDLTVSMRAHTDARVEEEGAVTLPARRFFQLIRELTSDTVEISCSTGEIAYISAGPSKFRLNGMHKSEFPHLPDFSASSSFPMPCEQLKDSLSKTAFAAAREDSRHVLNGVLMQLSETEATFVGTDGKRLAKVRAGVQSESSGEYLLPLKAVEELIKVLDTEKDATISLQADKVAIEVGPISLMTKLLAGQFPDVDRVIPATSNIEITLQRDELMTLLRQVSLFTTDRSHSVHFTFSEGELHLSATSSEIGEGKVSMPIDYSGEKLEIAFNPSFYLDILRHCKDETVTFSLTDSYNPGKITDSSSALYVIMPMRLNHA